MAARTCAECAHAHARDTRSLRSLVGPPEAPTFPPQDATNTKRGEHSLAALARGLPCGSPFAPVPLRLPPSLRSVGLPAFSARGKPPHSVSRAGERAALSPVHLLGPHSLRSPFLSLAALARCRSAPPACFRYGGRLGPSCARILSNPLRYRQQAALRSNRLQAG